MQRRSTVRSAHSLQRRGRKRCVERGRVYKDSMREEDITVEKFACVCMHMHIRVCMHCVHLCMSVCVCVCAACQLRMCLLFCVSVMKIDKMKEKQVVSFCFWYLLVTTATASLLPPHTPVYLVYSSPIHPSVPPTLFFFLDSYPLPPPCILSPVPLFICCIPSNTHPNQLLCFSNHQTHRILNETCSKHISVWLDLLSKSFPSPVCSFFPSHLPIHAPACLTLWTEGYFSRLEGNKQ